jgi:hypothetical protein
MANGRARCGGPFPLKCVAELPAVALDDEHHRVDRPAARQLEHVTEASHAREPSPCEERSDYRSSQAWTIVFCPRGAE